MLKEQTKAHLGERGFASSPCSWRSTPGTAGYEEIPLGRGPGKLREQATSSEAETDRYLLNFENRRNLSELGEAPRVKDL
jgi:hypothetical protein